MVIELVIHIDTPSQAAKHVHRSPHHWFEVDVSTHIPHLSGQIILSFLNQNVSFRAIWGKFLILNHHLGEFPTQQELVAIIWKETP